MKSIEHYIRLAGLKRTGNHGIINWLIAQVPGDICFRNNIVRFDRPGNPACSPIEALKRPGRRAVDLNEDCDKALLLCSYEDKEIDQVCVGAAPSDHSRLLGHRVRRCSEVVVVRDPFNYAASRLRSEQNGAMQGDLKMYDPIQRQQLFEMWKTYARAYLRSQEDGAESLIGISFNQWLISKGYRTSVCNMLGYQLIDDTAADVVTGWGGGSSFVGMRRDSVDAYFNRWRQYRHHSAIRDLLEDSEMMNLSDQIFGDTILSEIVKTA